MLPNYEDITDIAGKPDWFDQNGVPRYGKFHPNRITVYSREAVLFSIKCQGCGQINQVALSSPTMLNILMKKEDFGGLPDEPTLEQIRNCEYFSSRYLYYGDPPSNRHAHLQEGCAGATMTSDTVYIDEWWRTSKNVTWHRIPENEGILEETDEANLLPLGE